MKDESVNGWGPLGSERAEVHDFFTNHRAERKHCLEKE